MQNLLLFRRYPDNQSLGLYHTNNKVAIEEILLGQKRVYPKGNGCGNKNGNTGSQFSENNDKIYKSSKTYP